MARLRKVLSYPVIILLTINAIMGTGIFFLPAVGARVSGPASILAWLFMGIVSIYIAMLFAELTALYPKEGGIYEFCKQAFGRFWSFLIGWAALVGGNITIAMLVVGAVQYLLPIPAYLPKIAVSIIFILLFNYIAYRGMQTSAVMLMVFAIITLGTVGMVALGNLFLFSSANMRPFFVGGSLPVTVFLIAETFFGWETATFLAAETKDARRVLPKALILGTTIITVICLTLVLASLGSIPSNAFGGSHAPFTDLASRAFGSVASPIFTLLVYLSIIGSVAGWIVAAPRLILAMSQDLLFPRQFAQIHPVNQTPHKAILLQTIVSIILVFAGAGNYESLLAMLVPLILLMYSAVMMAFIVLRKKVPKRVYYTAPGGKVGASLVILLFLSLIALWLRITPGAMQSLRLVASFMLLGLPVYFLVQAYYSPHFFSRIKDILARSRTVTEHLEFPLWVRRKATGLLGDLEGKRIMEVGCNIGTLTLHLAEAARGGAVYAQDDSPGEILLVQERMRQYGHRHVQVFLEEHHIHKRIPRVDAVISIGGLSQADDPKKLLQDIAKRLPKGGRAVFVEYDRFFHILPNVEWVNDQDRLQALFRSTGFSMQMQRRQGLLWRYVFIHGYKT